MNTPPAALQVTGIAFAVYPVKDIARARQFYGGTLGMKVCMEMEFAPGIWWVEYDTGAGALGVTNYPMPGMNAGPTPGVTLEIANYDEALASLRAAGVTIIWGPNDFPPCRSFAVKDPDGNDLYFHQRKTAT
jgi:predicted enzyme related to lactoylglutathione lyase